MPKKLRAIPGVTRAASHPGNEVRLRVALFSSSQVPRTVYAGGVPAAILGLVKKSFGPFHLWATGEN